MAREHVNHHTVSGVLSDDAKESAVGHDSPPKRIRFDLRIGCSRFVRIDNKAVERVSYFQIRFFVTAGSKAYHYHKRRLLKGVEVMVDGEHIVDEIRDEAGLRWFNYIDGHKLDYVVDPVEEAKRLAAMASKLQQSTVAKPVAKADSPAPQAPTAIKPQAASAPRSQPTPHHDVTPTSDPSVKAAVNW